MTDNERIAVQVQAHQKFNARAVDELTDTLKDFIKEVRSEWEKSDERMDKMQKQLDMYATIIKLVKFGVGAFVLVVSLKLGDVRELWKQLFG